MYNREDLFDPRVTKPMSNDWACRGTGLAHRLYQVPDLDQLATTGAPDRKHTEYPDVSVYWQYLSGILCNVILPPLGNVG